MPTNQTLSSSSLAEPTPDCRNCPRLAQFRDDNNEKWPEWFNAPVPSFGDPDPALLIVGLAPGLKGANKTGRPFTGDFAGDLLYSTLLKFGLAEGSYDAHIDDGLTLKNCLITNAVRCVPPENKPTLKEQKQCQPFLKGLLGQLPNLKIILSLGRISHEAVLRTYDHKLSTFPFKHGAGHHVAPGIILTDSYHCSRYNTNTGRLTEEMFHEVFKTISAQL